MTKANLKIFFTLVIISAIIFAEPVSEASSESDFYDKAFKLAIKGKTNDAIQMYLKGLKIKPDSAETHHYLGVLYFKTGRNAEAIDHFKKAELFYRLQKDNNYKVNLEIIRNNLKKTYKKLNLNPDDFDVDSLASSKRRWKPSGIGFFIGNQGTLLTTGSSIARANKIRVKFSNGETEPVKLMREFVVYKIAILKPTNPSFSVSKPLLFDGNHSFKEGDTVYAIDFLKLKTPKPFVFKGKILRENALKNSDKVVQLGLEMRKGHDGGPLFNNQGKVIGLMLGKPTAQKSFTYLKGSPEKASFAIKSSYLEKLLSGLGYIKTQRDHTPGDTNFNSGVNLNNLSQKEIRNFVFLETFN